MAADGAGGKLNYFETRLIAQEIFNFLQERQEMLRTGNFRIYKLKRGFNKFQLGKETVGKVVRPDRLEKIFGERGRVLIQNFAVELAMEKKWHKFAVSHAEFRFSRDQNMMFFKIGEILPGEEGVEIIYLGTGRTDKIPEIANEIAADSWGFAVLNLKEDVENI